MRRTATALGIVIATAAVPLLAQRFDNIVRADFFAGYRGDGARLARGIETCEKALAADPHNAPALVWHGGGLFYESAQKFRSGDVQAGIAMQARGLKEMDDAVTMAPDDVQTLIPRGAVLLASAPFLPDPGPLTRKAIGDWEKVMALQGRGSGSTHSRGELLGGLAVGYRILGDQDNSAAFLKQIVAELPGSPYAERAKSWLENPAGIKKTDRFCIGCHE